MSASSNAPRNKGLPTSRAIFQTKFSTPSEQFFQFCKSLGYEVPKNLKHEHLDYMLKNEKSALFVKKMMAKIKSENVLTNDEIDQYAQLQKDGTILYGKDLERAVMQRTALDKKRTEDDRTEGLRTEELERLINLRQKEIVGIQKQDQVLRIISEKKIKSEESKQALRSQFQRESDNLDVAIQVARKRLGDKLEKLKEVKAEVLSRLESHNPNTINGNGTLIVDWDLVSFVDNEDKLIGFIEEFIVDHVPNLIIESEGCSERSEEESKIEDVISEYIEAFERLKHSLVLEATRKLKLSTQLEQEEAKLRVMNDRGAVKSLIRGMDIDNMMQIESELDARNQNQSSALNTERSKTLQTVRANVLQDVDNRFYSLVESRNRAKRRLEIFISRIYEILEEQKVRIDIVKRLVNKEIDRFAEMESDLVNLEIRLAELNATHKLVQSSTGLGGINISSINDEGKSFQKNLGSGNSMNENTSKSGIEFSIDTLENVEHQEQLKKLSMQVNHMRSKFDRITMANTACSESHVIKLDTQEKMAILEAMQEDHSISESVTEQMKLLDAMQTALSNHSLHFAKLNN